MNIAIVIHLYNTELASEMADILQDNVGDYYISTKPDYKDYIEQYFPHAIITEVENIGTDFYPFTSVFNNEILNYDLVLKIHSKKSEYNKKFKGWRNYLFDNLIINYEEIITLFNNTPDLGVLFPEPFKPIKPHVEWGNNYDNSVMLLKMMNINKCISLDNIQDYPAGSMFWFGPHALHQYFKLPTSVYSTSTMISKIGERIVDGDIAHSLERLVTIVTEYNRYKYKIYTPYK